MTVKPVKLVFLAILLSPSSVLAQYSEVTALVNELKSSQYQAKLVVDVRDYGAVADGQLAADCYMTAGSALLICESSHFVAGDVGKKIAAYGNGPSANGYYQPLSSTIASYHSGTQVTLADNAITSTQHTIATISSATRAGNAGLLTSTYNASGHGFNAGQMLNIVMTNSQDQTYSGLLPIDATPTSDSFTVRSTIQPMVNSSGGGKADGHSYRVVWGTDNTTALQAAVDAAATKGGGAVHFPGAVAGTNWTGLYLTHGISLPCSLIGGPFQNGYTCTLAYNNISLIGDGVGLTQLENWDTATNTSTYGALIWMSQRSNGTYDNVPPGPLHDIDICCMTLHAVPNNLQKVLGDSNGASQHVHVHDITLTGGKAEGLFIGGKSRYWEVDHVFGSQLGSPINGSIGLSALNLNSSLSRIHDNYVENSGQCVEASGHDNEFFNNTCNGQGLWRTSAGSIMLGLNIGSATYGIWNWRFGSNKFFGCVVQSGNVNGQAANIIIENNTFVDSGSIQLGTGKETNNIAYGPQQKIPHGKSIVRNNDFINDGLFYPVTYLMSTSNAGSTIPFLEDVVYDHNTFVFKRGYCQVSGNHTACDRNADCSSNSCTVPTLIYGTQGGVPIGAAKWVPNTSYAAGAVVVPSIDNTYIYMNKRFAFTSGKTEPTWCTTAACTIADSTGTWTLYGHRPALTITNTTVRAPLGLSGAGVGGIIQDISVSNGAYTGRTAVTISNLQSNVQLQIKGGTGTGGTTDAGFVTENIPAGMPYSDNRRYSDTLPTSGKWALGTTITKITQASGSSLGWVVTRAGYYGVAWMKAATCKYGDFVTALPDNNHVFRAINGSTGTTGRIQPSWNTGSGATTADNNCTWRESGTSAIFRPIPLSSSTNTSIRH